MVSRVASYLDGYNLYYGLRSKGWRRFYWLDVDAMSERLLRPDQTLLATNYFTARVPGPPASARRQSYYLDALRTVERVEVIEGRFQSKPQTCQRCGHSWSYGEEKKTDVNIAVSMLRDAARDQFDTALLISGDSDLVPAVQTLRDLYPEKRVVVGCPPGRRSAELCASAHASLTIGRGVIANSQLPQSIATLTGYILSRPQRWT